MKTNDTKSNTTVVPRGIDPDDYYRDRVFWNTSRGFSPSPGRPDRRTAQRPARLIAKPVAQRSKDRKRVAEAAGIKPGTEFNGTVVSSEPLPYGVFVRCGKFDGLLRNKDMLPEQVGTLKRGDSVRVFFLANTKKGASLTTLTKTERAAR